MMQIDKLSLKALRDQINGGTRTVQFQTDDGATTQMVYIPKFRIPAGMWDNGAFPAKDMNLGGFFIDKYQCSHKAATHLGRGISDGPTIAADDTTNVPVSLPGKVAWTQIDWTNAKQACANRKIKGVACHLVTMKEWATVCFLARFLGHDMHGNNTWGKDYRDADVWENRGVVDTELAGYNTSNGQAMSRILTGTGPMSYSHNGMADGVFDIVGNVWEWCDFLINAGVYTHQKKAYINDSDGITTADATITIDGMENADTWPSNGLVKIDDEYITYATINQQGSGKAILSGCSRAQKGSKAAIHADNAVVYQLTDYCVIPGGAAAYISNALAAGDTSITYSGLVNGPDNNGFSVGDTLQIEGEQATVTAVTSNVLTISRGVNGSAAASHSSGTAFTKISPQMDNNSPSGDAYQFKYYNSMRYEDDLAALALPKAVGNQDDNWKDGFWLRSKGARAARRGGSWGDGAGARAGFCLVLDDAPSDRYIGVGFRAALSLDNL